MGTTKIEWTDRSWNPVTGCTPISPGCAHCYARRMAKRLAGRCGYPAAPHEFDVTLHPEKLDEPVGWKKPSRVFVCSMSDLFHDDVPDSFIESVFEVIYALRLKHTFQILTKRPERMRDFVLRWNVEALGSEQRKATGVWFGVTAENQEQADKRIPFLLEIPAAVHFVSIEPMLGPIDLTGSAWWDWRYKYDFYFDRYQRPLDLVIVGGETGPGARPMNPDWVRSLRDQCTQADVPFFFKSFGDWIAFPDRSSGVYQLSALKPGSKTGATLPFGFKEIYYENGEKRVVRVKFEEYHCFLNVGKKSSGRTLDGREWSEYPTEQ